MAAKQYIKRVLTNQPRKVDVLIILFVVLHTVLSMKNAIPNIWELQQSPEKAASLESLYIGALGAGAIVAGFAGVVVIFALSAPGERFRKLRVDGGTALLANWTSTSASGFLSSLMFLVAAIGSILWGHPLAPFFFELGFLLLAHGSIRLLWLLRQFAEVVRATDIDSETSGNNESAGQYFQKDD